MSQADKWRENEKQYFPTETVFSTYQSSCLPSSNENIFSSTGVHVHTIIQFCGFYIFILKTALFLISIQCQG